MSTKTLLGTIRQFYEVGGFKVNVQISIVFFYTDYIKLEI